MERRFDMSDFERSLREHADQFRMMPSKRVWTGIYNHLHPGSKWPSITIAIVLLITLISIGNLNNAPRKQINATTSPINSSRQIISQKEKSSLPQADISNSSVNQLSENSFITEENTIKVEDNQTSKQKDKRSFTSSEVSPKQQENTGLNLKNQNQTTGFNIGSSASNQIETETIVKPGIASTGLFDENFIAHLEITPVDFSPESLPVLEKTEVLLQMLENPTAEILIPVSENIISSSQTPGEKLESIEKGTSGKATNSKDFSSEKKAVETALPKPPKKKRNNNVLWTFYATPTIGTVVFDRKKTSSSPILNPYGPSSGLKRTVKLGFEAGTDVGFRVSRKMHVITGFNLSYSGYNNVSNLIHPTFSSLEFVNKDGSTYTKNYVTNYGNGQSLNRIHLTNYSLEASIPVGIDYNIWQNGEVALNILGTVDPSVVLKKNAFVISSDGRYYVNDPSLVRNVNLAGHFNPYISFSAKKIHWHIGPDVRYQLLSTYKQFYPEKNIFWIMA